MMTKSLSTPALTLTVSLLLLTQCQWFDKDDGNPVDKLPPATQTGAYTFACLIDGQPWIVKGFSAGTTAMYQLEILFLSGDKTKDGIFQIISFTFSDRSDVETNQIYNLSRTDTAVSATYYIDYSESRYCRYINKHIVDGQIKLTRFDTSARIVSGTFELTVFNPDCGDTVRITDGRFDIPELVL